MKRRIWLLLSALTILAAAAIFDWNRPAQEQASVDLYEKAIVSPYRQLARLRVGPFTRCRYQPTCSQYSLEAVRAHGFPLGVWLTTKRLLRCVPWVPLGTPDSVPTSPWQIRRD